MGWFWSSAATVSDASEDSILAVPSENSNLFWAHTVRPLSSSSARAKAGGNTLLTAEAVPSDTPKCPVDHIKLARRPAAQAGTEQFDGEQPEGVSKCPVDHTKLIPRPSDDRIDPTNNMPRQIATSALPGQVIALSTERTTSSIPRGAAKERGNWEYPSPQQMLNAMVRKSGREGIDEDAVESMVDVHNFLNEGVWREVLEWERPHTAESGVEPRLLKFTGRPSELTPRARWLQFLSWLRPEAWDYSLPFDRHDWTVLRHAVGKDEWENVRYVIDFYEAPDENGMPAFNVDVRPALDSVSAIADRISRLTAPMWQSKHQAAGNGASSGSSQQ